jgi:hypothetical protein
VLGTGLVLGCSRTFIWANESHVALPPLSPSLAFPPPFSFLTKITTAHRSTHHTTHHTTHHLCVFASVQRACSLMLCVVLCLLSRCHLRHVLLGVAPFRSAPLGVLRPKPPWSKAWSSIGLFFCWNLHGAASSISSSAAKLPRLRARTLLVYGLICWISCLVTLSWPRASAPGAAC